MSEKWAGCLNCGSMGEPSHGWAPGAKLNCFQCGSDRVVVQRDDQTEVEFLESFITLREREVTRG